MARGINKVTLLGNVGNDPEIRHTETGDSVANISIATSESWKDKNTGEKVEQTEWHRVVFFGKLADVVGQYIKKGSKIHVEGKLQTRKWQDQNGMDKYTTQIVAHDLLMLDSGNKQGQDNAQGQQQGQRRTQGQTSPRQPARQQQANRGDEHAFDNDTTGMDFDNTIPF